MISKPLPFLLFLTGCFITKVAVGQSRMMVYNVKTKQQSALSIPAINTQSTKDRTNAFEGLYSQSLAILPLDEPTSNLHENTTFTNKTPIHESFNPTDYPIRTAIKLVIQDNGELFHSCSAAMISSRHVLTAAHCFSDIANPNVILYDSIFAYATFDNGEQQSNIPSAQVKKIYFFENWKTNKGEDMMILELDIPIGEMTGWLSIGFDEDNSFFENQNFHKLSYPGEKIFEDDTDYNGDTLYYMYGQLGFRPNMPDAAVSLSVPNYKGARPGESGSSLFYTDNFQNYTAYGVLNYYNDFKHSRIQSPQFYAFSSIIKDATSPVKPTALSSNIEIYPNPTADYVKVKFGNFTQAYTVFIVDATGRQVTFVEVAKGQLETQLDLTTYPSGMYHINIYDGKQVVSKPVVKLAN